jgi:uncharacterized protein
MEIASIKGDNVILMYHPGEAAAEVGQQFMILETPDEEGKEDGLVVQVISNDSLEYPGLQQEMIQHVLEERVEQVTTPVARERGMQEIKSLKLAAAKIRKRLHHGEWLTWDGWIPTRNVLIRRVKADDLIRTVVPLAAHPIPSFARFNGAPIVFDGPRFNMVNVTAGVKGSGKSHLAKHLLLGLSRAGVPGIVFDINGEYVGLPKVTALRWGDNFIPKLSEVGLNMLRMVVRVLHPLPSGSSSESTFENRMPVYFANRRAWCEQNGQEFNIDIPFLRSQRWSSQDMVRDAIRDRLLTVQRRGLFWETGSSS